MAFTGQLGSAQLGSFVLGGTAASGTEHDESASHTLTWTQSATYTLNGTFNEDADHALTFTQSATFVHVTPILADGSHTLAFAEDAEWTVRAAVFVDGDSTLTWTQVANATAITPVVADASLTLTFTAVAAATAITPILVDGDSSLSFTQSVGMVGTAHAASALTLDSQSDRLVDFVRAATQALSLAQAVAVNVIRNLSATNTLDFTAAFSRPLTLITNQPIVYVQPTARAVVVGPKCHFTLTAPSQAIVLRCPEFGDSEAGVGSVNVKKSMTGLTYAYARRSTKRRLKYAFQLGRQKALELEDFLTDHGTEIMRLDNHKGEVWYVACLSVPYEFQANSRWLNDEERIDIELEFEGVKVAG